MLQRKTKVKTTNLTLKGFEVCFLLFLLLSLFFFCGNGLIAMNGGQPRIEC